MKTLLRWTFAGVALTVFAGLNLPGMAQEATPPASTQPTTKPDRHDRRWGIREILEARQQRGGGFMQGRGQENYRNEEMPTDEEWDEIIDFMKLNSPARLEMYEKLESSLRGSQSERIVQGARRRIAGRYRDLMAMKDKHPDMYEFALRQTSIEDQILGTMRDLRSSSANEALQARLRTQIAAYVDNFLNEREARLKRLKEMVERETQTIQKDRASMEDLIDKQAERFERDLSRLLDLCEDDNPATQPAGSNP